MIPITSFAKKKILLFGLGSSGISTAQSLIKGGADVIAYDDDRQKISLAQKLNIPIQNLNDVDFSDFDALVLSPGVPFTHPTPHWTVTKAKQSSLEIIGDIELFNRERQILAPECPFIAITGTNGKSTTTALIAHILYTSGYKVQMGGNIGLPILTLDKIKKDCYYVVECSSYQIDLAPTLRPSIGVHLNISIDHIDRHGTIDNYIAVKSNLVLQANEVVIGVDDPFSEKIADELDNQNKNIIRVSITKNADVFTRGNDIFHHKKKVATVDGIDTLQGRHNLQNIAIAWTVCHKCGVEDKQIAQALCSFQGLSHRMEKVAKIGNTLFINDSKATNADAAAQALTSFDKIYWIVGGKKKNNSIENLTQFFPRIIHAFLIGETTEEFATTLDKKIPFSKCYVLDKAVNEATIMAKNDNKENSVILLSPACASWDQFSNFEARGDAFKRAVLLYKELA